MTTIVNYSRSSEPAVTSPPILTHSSLQFLLTCLKWGRKGGCILMCSGKYFNISFNMKTSYWNTFPEHIRTAWVPTFSWRWVQTFVLCQFRWSGKTPRANILALILTSSFSSPALKYREEWIQFPSRQPSNTFSLWLNMNLPSFLYFYQRWRRILEQCPAHPDHSLL